MALDAIAVRALSAELFEMLKDGRIEKIHQPERDELLFNIRVYSEHYRLVLSASSANPRIHTTDRAKKNPTVPPMFCMLLRKHLSGGKITGIYQDGFERIIYIDVENRDELGDIVTKKLIIELMGRRSNIILTDDGGRIIDSIRRVDISVSSVRQVLPGLMYERPPGQGRTDFTEADGWEISFVQKGMKAEKLLMSAYSGISPLTAREIVWRAYGRTDVTAGEAETLGADRLREEIVKLREVVKTGKFSPCMIRDGQRLVEFSAIAIGQYEKAAEVVDYSSINHVLDDFYSGRDAIQRMKQKSADLVHMLSQNIERASRKLELQRQTLEDAKERDKYKISGDLITANLYRINKGDTETELENFYDAQCPMVTIALDPRLTPMQNAQNYYKKYRKAKNAETEVAKQIKECRSDIDYLTSTLAAVEQAEDEEDLNQIRSELAAEGYIKRRTQKNAPKKTAPPKPMHFVSSDGFDIYVGKNNTQNDYLTLKFANSQDIWFHTKNIHGSHAVIKLGIDKEVPAGTIIEAAELAAYYSKARQSSQVPVDYTRIKNVKKPNGAKPGMVIYDSYNTIYVTPKGRTEE